MVKFFKNNLLIILILALSLFVALSLTFMKGKNVTIPFISAPITSTPTQHAVSVATTFSYKGQTGKDALTLLKTKTPINQDKSGLVVSINDRQADNTKHEYWAFYVNGKYASVGPASYQTKNTDVILWKIEKY